MSQLLTEIRGNLSISEFGVCRLLTEAATRGDLLDEGILVLSNVHGAFPLSYYQISSTDSLGLPTLQSTGTLRHIGPSSFTL